MIDFNVDQSCKDHARFHSLVNHVDRDECHSRANGVLCLEFGHRCYIRYGMVGISWNLRFHNGTPDNVITGVIM